MNYELYNGRFMWGAEAGGEVERALHDAQKAALRLRRASWFERFGDAVLGVGTAAAGAALIWS